MESSKAMAQIENTIGKSIPLNSTPVVPETPKYPVVPYNPNAVALSTVNYFNPILNIYAVPAVIKPDFYVGPNGASSTLPATAYRYMDSKWYDATKKEMSGPLSYFGFEKIDTAYQVRDRYQIAYDYYNLNDNKRTWSDASVRGTFDTLQLFNSKGIPKVEIPYSRGGTGTELEPFTVSYPEYGKGGAFQLIPSDKMSINYDRLDVLPNPRTDLILKEKR